MVETVEYFTDTPTLDKALIWILKQLELARA